MSWIKCNAKRILAIALSVFVACAIFMIMTPKSVAPGDSAGIAPIYQSDYKSTVVTVDGEAKSVWTSGCGAVVTAMAASYLTGTPVSCEDLFRWACDNGFYNGNGLDHPALVAMLAPYGLTGKWVDNSNLSAVKHALDSGRPVVAHVGPGTFTQNGHYILLIARDGERAVVNDPGSRQRSGQLFDLELIQKELRRENCFMIVDRV